MADLARIPYGLYWSSPFTRWQGALAHLHSLRFAAHLSAAELHRRGVDLGTLDYGVLGTTVPQQHCFYGLPWVTGMMGAEHIGGPTVNQACATSARAVRMAATEVADGLAHRVLVVTADRTSNGPQLYHPDPEGPGGAGRSENWVLDNFARDPHAGVAMVETADNVARRHQISTEEQHEVVLARHAGYLAARQRGFHARFMRRPFEVPDARFRGIRATLDGDEGIYPTSATKLAALKPVREGGTVTLGGQTHPADGVTGMLVTDRPAAAELSTRPEIDIRLRGFGLARTDRAHMPYAPIPAAASALAHAGVQLRDVRAVTTHNPFAVNDVVFARETGFDLAAMNRHGCSLIWGHPQGPTGLRAIIELIETLVEDGGGIGLFTGCAAGDTAMAVVLEVHDAGA